MNSELTDFLKAYEHANNSHVWKNVEPFIAPGATYWFTDGSYTGIEEIRTAIETTFNKIQGEVYEIENVHWPLMTAAEAVCTYTFSWRGVVDGQMTSGSGRGTNILRRIDDLWQIVHEHLSN
jgi:ketosteroid isomerase-like protein